MIFESIVADGLLGERDILAIMIVMIRVGKIGIFLEWVVTPN